MGLQKSNRGLQKSRRLGFTFTFHFNVIKQLVFCIDQYKFLWTLEINIHLSLKASVNIVFKVHKNLHWPQQKTIIVYYWLHGDIISTIEFIRDIISTIDSIGDIISTIEFIRDIISTIDSIGDWFIFGSIGILFLQLTPL